MLTDLTKYSVTSCGFSGFSATAELLDRYRHRPLKF